MQRLLLLGDEAIAQGALMPEYRVFMLTLERHQLKLPNMFNTQNRRDKKYTFNMVFK